MTLLRQRRHLISIVLSAIAIGVIVFYSICGNSCSYLKGSILGIELQYIGIAYMAALICLNIVRSYALILIGLSAGLGVEAFLVRFQLVHGTYCPYCLVFGLILLLQFVLGFEWKRKWLAALSFVLGLVLFAALFRGTAFPTYTL